jgi:hypothetical protein
MGYGSVRIPAGCTVKIGADVGALTDLGVLKGDAQIEITYDMIKVLGSKAESLKTYIKNMVATGTFEMYQLFLDNIQKLLDGAATVSTVAGAPVVGYNQVVASGSWIFDRLIPLTFQNGSGAKITPTSVTGSVDGALVLNADYWIVKDANGIWGISIRDSVTVTTEAQNITIVYDYTPAASKTLKMGAQSAELTPKIVEFSLTIAGKIYRVRLWSVTNEAGLTLGFPESASDDLTSMPVSLKGGLDAARATGEQLVEVYDEIGLSMS